MSTKTLEEFVKEVSGTSHLRIEHDFGGGFVRLHTSEAERRQAAQDIRSSEDILIELLRNARDAHASHIFVSIFKSGDKRTITVIDDGDGIPESMHEHIFESRVTSKLDTLHKDKWGMHGRGMALYSISENADSARVVASEPDLGCAIQVVSNTSNLPEKADQSSFPTFAMSEDGSVNVRGPKNLLRTACEFAIEERSTCSVFFGSPTETIAALYAYGISSLSSLDRLFCKDVSTLPICKRLATASDPKSLACMSQDVGFDISDRSARRVMDGEIAPSENILNAIAIIPVSDGKSVKRPKQKAAKRARISFSNEDLSDLKQAAEHAFKALAEKYYLETDVKPSVRSVADKLTISLPIIPRQ